MIKTKTRGLGRKCQAMVDRIEQATQRFPQPHTTLGCWHLHLPVGQQFINSKSTPFSVQQLCVRTLVERAQHLVALAPSNWETRVVVAIDSSDFHQSQIIVFFGNDYFRSFFARNSEEQHWVLLSGKGLCIRWNLMLPSGFSERVYRREINEEDGLHKSQIYFIGQLD